MEEIDATPRFRQGAGRLSLDFVRTLRYRGTPGEQEELPDGAALARWVRQCGPALDTPPGARAGGRPGEAEVRAARALREAVYAHIAAARSGGSPGPEVAARLNGAAAPDVPVPYLSAQGALRWRADDPVSAVLALVARDALELAADPALVNRLHECAAPDCGAVFLDSSRPGTRRWCSMDVCGNRAKKSALRARTSA